MHQTFYIDIDEEITSIVERLRKSTAKEVVIVVPKRALLIQSIINLKLLKKEADEYKKDIIIVTQDKFGKLMIEKTGITVEQRLDDVIGEEMVVPEKEKNISSISSEPLDPEVRRRNENRLDKIGSPGFFYSDASKKDKAVSDNAIQTKNIENEKLTNTELVTDIGVSIKNKRKENFEDRREKAELFGIRNIDIKQRSNDDFNQTADRLDVGMADFMKERAGKFKISSGFFRKEKLPEKKDNGKELRFELAGEESAATGRQSHSDMRKNGSEYKDANLSKKSRKIFTIFGSVAVLTLLLSAAYIFLPKAKVTIFPKTKMTSADMDISADPNSENINSEAKTIPSRTVSISEEINKDFEATGSKGASNFKARGTITIYNEYSPAVQPLVATTRFLSEDGKLFRLVSGVSVPGVTTVDSESRPGAIEAEVVADESGGQFNVGPSRFSIPGFQNSGNEKYTKIYAKSFKAMTGGGSGGETVKTVTETDISSAKSLALSEISAKIKERLKNEAGDGYVVLDEAMSLNDPIYKISNSPGDTNNSFNVNLKIDAKAIVFREEDLQTILAGIIGKDIPQNEKIVDGSIIQEFGKAEADFSKSILKIKVHADAKVAQVLDLDAIKKEILGKNNSELEAYIKLYPNILRFEVEYSMPYISERIPQYGSRVEISLDNN